jgi:hypothetical protein
LQLDEANRLASQGVLKLFLILAGIAVAGLLLIGASAWYWWDQHSAELIAAGKVAVADGQKTGSRIEEAACVVLALERHKSDWKHGITSAVQQGLWLTGCLDASRPQQKFCEGVPLPYRPVAIGMWSATSCAQHGSSDPSCHTTFQTVSKYCSSPGRAEKLRTGTPGGPAT